MNQDNIKHLSFEDDMTQDKAESMPEDRESRIMKLINHAKLGMVVINQNHRAIEANQRFADMLGYTIDEVLELYTWEWEALTSKEDIRDL